MTYTGDPQTVPHWDQNWSNVAQELSLMSSRRREGAQPHQLSDNVSVGIWYTTCKSDPMQHIGSNRLITLVRAYFNVTKELPTQPRRIATCKVTYSNIRNRLQFRTLNDFKLALTSRYTIALKASCILDPCSAGVTRSRLVLTDGMLQKDRLSFLLLAFSKASLTFQLPLIFNQYGLF